MISPVVCLHNDKVRIMKEVAEVRFNNTIYFWRHLMLSEFMKNLTMSISNNNNNNNNVTITIQHYKSVKSMITTVTTVIRVQFQHRYIS